MSDSALSVRYRKIQYQAQSDIADHGYRTKCPPMGTVYKVEEQSEERNVGVIVVMSQPPPPPSHDWCLDDTSTHGPST